MFQKAGHSTYIESESLLNTMIRWRKPLVIVTFTALVVSVIFSGSYFITPLYKSTVVLFPTATNSISKALLDLNSSDRQDILAFGEEEQAEQMLQLFGSDAIRNAIISKYNLMEHYKISPDSKYPVTKLYNEFSDKINFKKTEFQSVKIEVWDSDPAIAAAIANDIAELADSLKTKLQHDRALQAMKILEEQYVEKERLIQLKEDSLQWIGEKGVMNYKTEAGIWNEEYAKSFSTYNNEIASLSVLAKYKSDNDTAIINSRARIEGARERIKTLRTKLDQLVKYGGANISLNEQLILDREELSKIKMQYTRLKMDAQQWLPHQFIINHAVKAERHVYPVRSLVVLLSGFCSFVLALIVVIIIDRVRDYI
jgi:uncharacterized protein involved in exopolysaccharide biosynthesis